MNILLLCLSGLVRAPKLTKYSLGWTLRPIKVVLLFGGPFVPWPLRPMAVLSSGPYVRD